MESASKMIPQGRKDMQYIICVFCKSGPKRAYLRNRTRNYFTDEDFDEIKRMQARRKGTACDSCGNIPATKGVLCSCYVSPHYCNVACQNNAWNSHRKFCSSRSTKRNVDESIALKIKQMNPKLIRIILPRESIVGWDN
jgi:hypothetical protein